MEGCGGVWRDEASMRAYLQNLEKAKPMVRRCREEKRDAQRRSGECGTQLRRSGRTTLRRTHSSDECACCRCGALRDWCVSRQNGVAALTDGGWNEALAKR